MEEKLPEKPAVVEDKESSAKVVVKDEGDETGTVKIEEPENIGEIVLDTGDDNFPSINTETTTKEGQGQEAESPDDEGMVIFGETDNQIGNGVSEEVDKTSTADEIQQKNRLTGFVILLVIAVILAVWYVREKKQIEKLEKGEDKEQKDSK